MIWVASGGCLYLEVYPGPTKGGPGVSLHQKIEVKEIKWILCARFGWSLWSQYLLLCTLKSTEALGQQTRCLCAVWLLHFSSQFQYILEKLSERFFRLWFWCRILCTCIMENSIWKIAILKEAWISSLAIVLLSWSIVISTASQQVI